MNFRQTDETTGARRRKAVESPEDRHESALTPCDCASPAICTMDYAKYSPSPRGHWTTPQPMVNRVCTKCWTHWFGPVGKVVEYTKAAWDKWMSECFDHNQNLKDSP